MESTVAQTTTLLTLPIEIRRLILGYAFIAQCAPTYPAKRFSDLDIQVTPILNCKGRLRPIRLNHQHGAWGKECMTRILRVNQQLLSEATEVLYGGDFVFHFPASCNAVGVHHWLEVIGDKKSLAKKISVTHQVHLGQFKMAAASLAVAKGFVTLKRELVNLKSVEMRVVFRQTLGLPPESEQGRVGIQRECDALTYLVGIFRGLATLVVVNHILPDTPWKGLVDACVERMEEAVK